MYFSVILKNLTVYFHTQYMNCISPLPCMCEEEEDVLVVQKEKEIHHGKFSLTTLLFV